MPCLQDAQNVVLLRGEAGPFARGGGGGRQRINVVPNQEGELERSDRDQANGVALPSFLLSPSRPLRQQMAQLFVVLLRVRVYGQPTDKSSEGQAHDSFRLPKYQLHVTARRTVAFFLVLDWDSTTCRDN